MAAVARSAPLALAAVFSVSFFAYGQLGGAAGIDVPFTGHLDSGGVPLTDSAVDFTFSIYDSALAPAPCDTVTTTNVVVVDGRFATVIDDVAEACVKGKDPHVEVAVDAAQSGSAAPLLGRQRLYPAVGAYSSGTGDFHATGAVDAASLNVRGAASVTSSLSAGSVSTSGAVSAGSMSSTGTATVNHVTIGEMGYGASVAGVAYNTMASPGNYALLQDSSGNTILNAASGRTIDFRTNNGSRMTMSSTGVLTTSTGVAPGSGETLRIVRGTVFADGTIATGSGFSVSRVGTGVYDVTFSTAFSSAPTITCSAYHPTNAANGSGSGQCMVNHPSQVSGSGARIYVAAGSGGNADFPWGFIAIGPR